MPSTASRPCPITAFSTKSATSRRGTNPAVRFGGYPGWRHYLRGRLGAGGRRTIRWRGARLVLNLNASPYHIGKAAERGAVVRERNRCRCPVYVNMVGGQDELVFDGASLVMNAEGRDRSAGERSPNHCPAEFAPGGRAARPVAPLADEVARVYRALVMGVRDYVQKNRFPGVVLGLSGGLDSRPDAAVAMDALCAAGCRPSPCRRPIPRRERGGCPAGGEPRNPLHRPVDPGLRSVQDTLAEVSGTWRRTPRRRTCRRASAA